MSQLISPGREHEVAARPHAATAVAGVRRTSAGAQGGRAHKTRCGWKNCRHCGCQKFEGSGNTCRCGHSFYDHWN